MRDDRSRCDVSHRAVNHALGVALIAALVVAGGRGSAGHQVGHYPSYYPDEIRVDVADPAEAARGLADGSLHAYVGTAPAFSGPLPPHVKVVTSFGSFLVLSFNPAAARFASAQARCATGRQVLAKLREGKPEGFVIHPYPVTPYHADYLHHLDRIEAAHSAAAEMAELLKIGARGGLAEAIVRGAFGQLAEAADVTLETVAVDELIGPQSVLWPGPPWLKEGWFQAHRLLAQALDPARPNKVDDDYERLTSGATLGLADRTDLERRLVATLTQGCERVVVGYTLRQEFINETYPSGIENVAFDSLTGLNSAVFVRTVKLKDYPWNGKLQLAVRERPQSAWNPVAGFTDPIGRLIWSAISDPAMIAFPFNASFMPNRVQSELSKVEGLSGGIRVPADAIRPQAGSGTLRRVGERTFASARVTYHVLASPFEDGTEMATADLLYPYVFAFRWGASENGRPREPRLKAAFTALGERLVGIKAVRVDKTRHAVAEGMNIVQTTPVLEVYLHDAPGDERQMAALSPPWSTLPWHLLVLMEEAVGRGHAAFSQEEAARRGVAWLDLVRDPTLAAVVHELVAQFERDGYRPEPLKELVTAEAAQARWRALKAFAQKNGHFLVTNGPYRLKQWGPDSVVLEAVRDFTYPLGFGTFDRFVHPPRAVIEAVTQAGDEITVRAGVEMNLKAGRGYKLVTEPLTRSTTRGVYGLLVVSRYLLLDPEGKVLTVDKMQWRDDGQFAIKLPDRLPPGEYTVILGIFLDGNLLDPPARPARARGRGLAWLVTQASPEAPISLTCRSINRLIGTNKRKR